MKRSVQDEGGYNQGWTGGLSTQIRSDRRCDLMITQMRPDPSRRVLEIGCGRGEIARRLAAKTGMQVLAIDRSDGFVDEARTNAEEPNLEFKVADFTRPDELGESSFDYVIGNGILHHLYYNLDSSLEAMRRLLSDEGRLVFLEPNLHNPYVYLIFTKARLRKLAKLEPDEMAFTRKFALTRLRAAGFRDITVEYRDFLLPGVPDWLIGPLVRIGAVAEQTPGLKHLAQSIFISASR
jgi:2-polyprenyl-3-methyl-5-hydroxy-6-metoxy-1,4-benzoquinol methylase